MDNRLRMIGGVLQKVERKATKVNTFQSPRRTRRERQMLEPLKVALPKKKEGKAFKNRVFVCGYENRYSKTGKIAGDVGPNNTLLRYP